jgi:hypothetical protein
MFKYSHVPAWSFGKSQKPDPAQAIPGPGAYDPDKADHVTRKQEITSVKIKPSHLPDFHSNNKVGPGQYNPTNDNWKSPTAKFPHAERGRSITKNVPGPGQYDYDKTEEALKCEKKNTVFPKATRLQGLKSMGPGPGQYQTQENTTRVERYRAQSGYRFDKTVREGMYKDKPVPGPGTYTANPEYILESKGRGYSLGKASGKRPVDGVSVPGPGTYDPTEKGASGNIKFGKRERINPEIKKTAIPGPGQYEADQVFNKLVAQPGVKFGKSSTITKENQLPGPGNYDPQVSAFDKRSAAFMKEERGKMHVNPVPGPGQYDSSIGLTSKSGNIRFGKEARGRDYATPVPGPGAYDSKANEGAPTFKMPRDTRLKDHRNDVPGPGQYDQDMKYWDKHFPKFGHATALGMKGLDIGPGMYTVPHSIPDVPRYNYPGYETRKIKI